MLLAGTVESMTQAGSSDIPAVAWASLRESRVRRVLALCGRDWLLHYIKSLDSSNAHQLFGAADRPRERRHRRGRRPSTLANLRRS